MYSTNNKSELHFYLSATILINLFCLFINGYEADLGFWTNWTHQLADKGYHLFNGNYPPLYIHWLYFVSQLLGYLNYPAEPNDLYKFFWEFPVMVSHCLLVIIVFKNLQKFGATKNQTLYIMLLTVFNPAILIDGPIWGQVDLIPVVIALCAVLVSFSSRYSVLMLPIFTLALLTKFQMVCFLPIIGILFLHRFKIHLIGILLSVIVFLIVFSPFIFAHYFKEAFQAAYIETLDQYPVITMNAANIWILLVGNNAPDNIEFLSHINTILPQGFIYPKYLGMFLYASICMSIFILGVNSLLKVKKTSDSEKFLSDILLYSMVSAIAFFTLLPAMHERYLFPAVICALLYSSVTKKYLAYAIVLSAASALNMLIILGINGSNIWFGLSTLVTLTFVVSLCHLLAGGRVYNIMLEILKSFFKIPFASAIIFVVGTGGTLAYLLDRHNIHKPSLASNQILLNTQHLLSVKQEYGTIQFNRSMDGKPLSVGNRRFAFGIGTHARSSIVMALPKNAVSFDVIPGIDDEVGSANLIFEVWEDNKLVWASQPYYGFESPKEIHIELNKGKELKLVVNPHGENAWDHADWINPIITMEKSQ